jgi:hypothetical protein
MHRPGFGHTDGRVEDAVFTSAMDHCTSAATLCELQRFCSEQADLFNFDFSWPGGAASMRRMRRRCDGAVYPMQWSALAPSGASFSAPFTQFQCRAGHDPATPLCAGCPSGHWCSPRGCRVTGAPRHWLGARMCVCMTQTHKARSFGKCVTLPRGLLTSSCPPKAPLHRNND